MSTVMYAYRVKKSEFWNIFDDIRILYENSSIITSSREKIAKDGTKYRDVMEALRIVYGSENETKLQVFEFGDEYIFRVLENGYYFMNNHESIEGIEPCFYDDRSDIEEDEIANKPIAIELDKLISKGHFFIVHTVDYEWVRKLIFEDAFSSRQIRATSAEK